MQFINRETDLAKLRGILSEEPSVIWFIYGPINSGKTALITKVIEDLPENYRIFYINFRGFEGGYEKFIKTMFEMGDENLWRKFKTKAPLISAAIEYVEKVAKKVNSSIELPAEVIKMLHTGGMKARKIDVFSYLEKLMKRFKEKGFKPVLIFDELQVIKDEINATGMPLLARLFNFLVRMTKETHLCHSLCATSDCLFIEEIYSNARLEGRAEYFLVDDLNKEEAFKFYEAFQLKEKELLWQYVGGKIGDIIRVRERKKLGETEPEIIEKLKRDAIQKLLWIKVRLMKEHPEWKPFWHYLKKMKETEELSFSPDEAELATFWIRENILFFNPTTGILRPQSKLISHAIKEVMDY